MIFPADAPAVAVVSGYGVTLRLDSVATENNDAAPQSVTLRLLCDLSALPADAPRELSAPGGIKIELIEANPEVSLPPETQEFVISRADDAAEWGAGRAEMQYRDLIPGRLGGRFVASHIRIPAGGEVLDYAHYHNIRFQMIYCKAGWVRVVYEDQGEPFVLEAGDCVLQPPLIRHRVLEASPGVEVIEIGCPAIHETFADHDLPLPTANLAPERIFGGQQFIRHHAREYRWQPNVPADGYETRDTGIAAATEGLAGVRVIRSTQTSPRALTLIHAGEFRFLFVLRGAITLDSRAHGRHQLQANDACVIPAHTAFMLDAEAATELLEVTLPTVLPTENV